MSLEEAFERNTHALIALTEVILQNGSCTTIPEKTTRTRRTKAELAAAKAEKEAGTTGSTDLGLDPDANTPTGPEVVTLEQLKANGHALVACGDNQEGLAKAKELISKFGAKLIDEIKPEDYSKLNAEFVKEVKNWGQSEVNTQL